MRYPRNAKIFRGQLDVAPFIGVFFLLLLFVVMASLLYMPGLPVYLSGGESVGRTLHVRILSDQKLEFKGKEQLWPDFRTQFEEELKARGNITRVSVKTAPDGDTSLLPRIRELARLNRLTFDPTGSALTLPAGHNWGGTTNPTLTVAVDLGGQFFYQNQLVNAAELQSRLSLAVEREKLPITLIVLADQATEQNVMVKLAEIARASRIDTMLLSLRPRAWRQPVSKQ